MKRPARCLRLAAPLLLAAASAAQEPGSFPEDHRRLERTISYAGMESFLRAVDGKGPVRVSVEGRTAQGRAVYLVHLTTAPPGTEPAWKVLFYAQQHGDEVSGKDALLYLVREVAREPSRLPPDVDLWILPMMNPDGAEAGTRRNAAGVDLNRDHIVLEQPETQALHRVVRRVRPHLAVDAHEFAREPEEWRARGLRKWPDITMDGLNNPLFDAGVVAAARRWVDEAADAEARAGHPFLRYWVGGVPPDDEQRHSAPDVDGGLNAVGMYGGLSFIIEAAAYEGASTPAGDLGNRVDAYLVLFRRFVAGDGHRPEDLAAIARARARPVPPFLPTNALWVNPAGTVTEFPVVEASTGRVLKIATANMMTEIAVKKTVPAPLGYAVTPAAAEAFRALLGRHGIPFETLAAPRTVSAEAVTLVRVEDEFDELYSRYGGRQIVRRGEARPTELAAGSLFVPLEGEAAVRAALVLEPAALYGLYQYPRFRALAGRDGSLPVLRVVGRPEKRP
ncbi:MAG TPA: M14 family zinc carboxypeptidase [Thermoanaerobaculia bacterium]|nr:M14 family zinc carboxypeptidase [Thermoanaerobaculia bacterium]